MRENVTNLRIHIHWPGSTLIHRQERNLEIDRTCLLQPPGYPKKDKWEPLLQWVDVQGDLSIFCSHRSYCKFYRTLSHIFTKLQVLSKPFLFVCRLLHLRGRVSSLHGHHVAYFRRLGKAVLRNSGLSKITLLDLFTLSIRTPHLLTILVLKFEQVRFTTPCCV